MVFTRVAQKRGYRLNWSMKDKQRVVLGMSGGVDSSVAAEILLRESYEVEGVTCLFVDDEKSRQSAQEAAATAHSLEISHRVLDCTDCFSRQVISPFVEAYRSGITPSPCVGCNASCKIPSLIGAAQSLDCDLVATGHYARIERNENNRFVVKTAKDTNKDQSYMLSRLTQQQLSRLVLPLGTWHKGDIRDQAKELNLSIAEKPDSQDICFIEGSHLAFLEEQGIEDFPGDIVDVHGKMLGTHAGLHAYTIGQRKGIGVAADQPYYVIEKRAESNELVIGFKAETTICGVEVRDVIWQAFEKVNSSFDCMVKLRYRSKPASCRVEFDGRTVRVLLDERQPTTAPGQFAVFYQNDMVLGSGIIKTVIR